MEWLFIICAVVAWLIYRGAKVRKSEERHSFRSEPASLLGRSAQSSERSGRAYGHQARSASVPARWIPHGEQVSVGGFRLDGGMFYFGSVLPGQAVGQCGNCVIDPTSKVASSGLDQAGQTMSYWPSYQSIPPVARRTYLKWLADGRVDPSIGIGYVFLFFYGIERRLFFDQAKGEAQQLIAEVRRLLQLYGENGSFRGYATRFLDAAQLMSEQDIGRPQLSPDLRSGYEMPLSVRLYLGRKIASHEPLDARDGLTWVLSLPDTSLRTPARRCFPELVDLWEQRFTARFPNGLKVNPPKARLKLDYRAASSGFNFRIDISSSSGGLPDISVISAPIDGLRNLLNSCTEELSAYSRLLGRNPEARGSIEAAFTLPKELLASGSTMGAAVVAGLENLFGGKNVAAMRVTQLAKALSLDVGARGKIPTGMCNQIGAFLDRLDIGFEPDRRYGSRNLQVEGYALLFKAAGGAKVDGDTPAFVAARAMIDVAALAANADGKIEPGEFESIKTDIRAVPDLGGVEKARLMAYASVLLKDTLGHQAANQKLKSLGHAEKEAVVRSATATILSDGQVTPAEVKFLERLYRTLGLPEERIYASLHRGSVVTDEPIQVAPELRSAGVPIPAPANAGVPHAGGIQIDRTRLERLRSETSAVSELLAGIFIDEQAAAPAPTAPSVPSAGRFSGLDASHSALLAALLDAESVDRGSFEEQARSLRLLPDGAIERINDWGFDQFGEPLIEEDEVVAIVAHLRSQLLEAETVA